MSMEQLIVRRREEGQRKIDQEESWHLLVLISSCPRSPAFC